MEVLYVGTKSLAIGKMEIGEIKDEKGKLYLIDSKNKYYKLPVITNVRPKINVGDVIEFLIDFDMNIKNILETLFIIRPIDNTVIMGDKNSSWHKYYNFFRNNQPIIK